MKHPRDMLIWNSLVYLANTNEGSTATTVTTITYLRKQRLNCLYGSRSRSSVRPCRQRHKQRAMRAQRNANIMMPKYSRGTRQATTRYISTPPSFFSPRRGRPHPTLLLLLRSRFRTASCIPVRSRPRQRRQRPCWGTNAKW